MSALEALRTREMGQIPISIGTSLALEGAFGILEDKPVTPAPILEITELYINLRTLFRNIVNCLDSTSKKAVLPAEVLEIILDEIEQINFIVERETGGRVQPIYYLCSYESMHKKFPKARFKPLNTELQKTANAIEQNTMRAVTETLSNDQFSMYDIDIPGNNDNAFIVTHLPVDLLSAGSFRKLKLLESHTGKVKSHGLWYTKLTGGSKLPPIPFNRFTIQIFGDSNHYFSGYPIKIKRTVLALAEKYRWTPATTKDKVLYGIKQLHDPAFEVLAIEMFKR